MNGLPYYKAYPRDFIEATAGWPLDLKGAYRVVLDLIYLHGGRLADDPRFIAGNLGCSVRAWNGYRARLIEADKLQVIGGFLANYRADKELESLRSFQEKQRENASKTRKNNEIAEATAKPKASHTEPDTEEEKREANASQKKTRGTRLSADWFLPIEWGEWALSQGLGHEAIRSEADKFKDYWMARAGPNGVKLDWAATWRNWIRAAKEKGHGNGNRISTTSTGGKRADPALEQIARLTGIGAASGDGRGGAGGFGEEAGPLWMGARPQ